MPISILQRLRNSVPTLGEAGGSDSLDQSTLRRRVVAGILALKQRARRGVEILPPAVRVKIRVGPDSSISVVKSFIDEPEFDADVEADLLNRLVGSRAEALPARLYQIEEGETNGLEVAETRGGVLAWVQIEGGDRDGAVLPIQASRASYRLGRGEWHGDDTVANDLVVSYGERFISRRAAVLRRAGSCLEVSSLGQGDCLVVIYSDGRSVRPSHTRGKGVRIRPGDRIELTDGASGRVTLRIHGEEPTTEKPSSP